MLEFVDSQSLEMGENGVEMRLGLRQRLQRISTRGFKDMVRISCNIFEDLAGR